MGNHRAERAPKRRTSAPAAPVTGKRRATPPPRRSVVRNLPSLPLVAGVAVLAVSAGGAVTASGAGVTALTSSGSSVEASGALGAAAGQALSRRGAVVSRDYTRDSGGEETDPELIALAEKQMAERAAKLEEMRKAAEKQAAKIKENKWVLPLASYSLTATFGQYGLWASYHTGLDFNGNTGDPIMAVANGTVTSTGYDGAYGNKTVITLDDGTEIWFCHQTSIYVSVGDRVNGGEVIGTVGATGNVTGSHLHLEVRPGGGGPVDPFQAFVEHGIVP
jgi:murein DD-endopeptidase MepM/ murein hydrolase activator NlpD